MAFHVCTSRSQIEHTFYPSSPRRKSDQVLEHCETELVAYHVQAEGEIDVSTVITKGDDPPPRRGNFL